ncbi:MAG: VCBS repeat-containing protein, partial [Acidobacteriia bacterium]|nr:VCBS repeat-containing protein [Terriglobia bacterium]
MFRLLVSIRKFWVHLLCFAHRPYLRAFPALGLVAALGLFVAVPVSVAQQFSVGMFSPWPGYAIPNGVWLTGDFNGDGKTDILHAVENTDYANVWLSNGDGTFKVTSFSPWPGYAIPNGVWLTGDFNGDGKTDVLHAVQDTDYANVWLSNGDGTFKVTSFSPWSGYAIPNGIWMAGDFNGDGKTDILHAVANTDYANVWLSKGDGTFNVTSFSPW